MTTSRWTGWHARRKAIALSTALLTAGATLTAITAASSGAIAGSRPADLGLPNGPGKPFQATVTLITGDKILYTETADGRANATVVDAPTDEPRSYLSYGDPTGFYLMPESAEPLVIDGELDRELFDVKYLAHNGYGDDERSTMPVIVSYQPAAVAAATRVAPGGRSRLGGAIKRHDLTSLSGESLAVDKRSAVAFWRALGVDARAGASAGNATPHLGNGLRKVWLDRKIQVDLSESVPLIGAPEAWASGYDGTGITVAVLDTGVDAAHPDLAGKVTASQSFIPGATSTADGHGHGTHVASTIVGSGAASGGLRKGVAPGARLIVGKVLDDRGSGDTSWAIDAMEWAAGSGAKVVSMSLGAQVSDGTDPGSAAVNRLTATTGALFVIAAGNKAGAGVTSPATADAALAVAALSKADLLASFSSRGPRFGDAGLKPEISAPGVAIVAARAAGTSLGTPVDQFYTSLNGTSMATPHVAGAAAILAQQHPDWKAAQLKPALMSTTKDAGLTVYEQGAGRLDVGRAVRQRVHSATAAVDFRSMNFTGDSTPITKQVTYVNGTDQAVTLTLTPTLRSTKATVPASALTADPTVTVPARGTATATISLALNDLAQGTYTGAVVASDQATGIRLTVPVGLTLGPRLRKVNVVVRGRDDEPQRSTPSQCVFLRLDDTDGNQTYRIQIRGAAGGSAAGSGYVADGVYDVKCSAGWSARGSILAHALVGEPEFTISADTTLTFDLADAVPVRVDTPRPAETVMSVMGRTRTTASGQPYWSGVLLNGPYGQRLYTIPTKNSPTIGRFKFYTDHIMAAPEAVTTVFGKGRTQVRPVYLSDAEEMPKFTSDQRLELATKADLYAGRDVRGKLVVVDSAPYYSIQQEVDLATTAGAAGVLNHVVRTVSGGPWGTKPILDPASLKIPVLWLDGEQWSQVASVLDGAEKPSVHIRSRLVSPYEYKLKFYEYGAVPGDLDYRVDERRLAKVETEYHNELPAAPNQPNMSEAIAGFGPEDVFVMSVAHTFDAPIRRTEFYTVTGPDILWARTYTVTDRATKDQKHIQSYRGFSTPSSRHETVNQLPAAPRQNSAGPEWTPSRWVSLCVACRQGDRLFLDFTGTVPVNDRGQWHAANGSLQGSLTRDGVEIPIVTSGTPIPYATLPAEQGTYTLRTEYQAGFTGQRLAKTVATDWTFRSVHSDADNVAHPYACGMRVLGSQTPCTWQPLVHLDYGFHLDLDETASAGRPFAFTVTPWLAQPDAPAIAGVRVSVSYDDGAHWTRAVVGPRRGSSYDVWIHHPRLRDTSGAVSIRAEAWTTAGDRVVQRIDRAYGLR